MYGEEDIVKEDVNNILQRNGFSSNDFKITIETGTSYNPSQIVGTQVSDYHRKELYYKKI